MTDIVCERTRAALQWALWHHTKTEIAAITVGCFHRHASFLVKKNTMRWSFILAAVQKIYVLATLIQGMSFTYPYL